MIRTTLARPCHREATEAERPAVAPKPPLGPGLHHGPSEDGLMEGGGRRTGWLRRQLCAPSAGRLAAEQGPWGRAAPLSRGA